MRILPISLVVPGACALIIIGAGLYLIRSNPGTDSILVRDLQKQVSDRNRIIEELRISAEHSRSHVLQAAESHPIPLSLLEREGNSASEILALQERLEATMQRLDERIGQLEERLLRGKLVRMTPEQRDVASKGTLLHYGRFQEELNKANQEVRLIASRLNVPEAVTKISPSEALSDPRYEIYRPYFKARIAAKQAEMVVDSAMREIARISLEAALDH